MGEEFKLTRTVTSTLNCFLCFSLSHSWAFQKTIKFSISIRLEGKPSIQNVTKLKRIFCTTAVKQ